MMPVGNDLQEAKDSVSDSQNNNDDDDKIVDPEDAQLTMALIQNGTIDPMIGMHGIKPADFQTS